MWFRWRNRKTDGESEKALREAEKAGRAVNRRGREVSEIAEALKEFRERNHFAEQLEAIIIRRRGQLR